MANSLSVLTGFYCIKKCDGFSINCDGSRYKLRCTPSPPSLGPSSTILEKLNGKPRPSSPPQSRMAKWRLFALRAASSLIWGGGDGGLLFHFILFKIVAISYSQFVFYCLCAVRSLSTVNLHLLSRIIYNRQVFCLRSTFDSEKSVL